MIRSEGELIAAVNAYGAQHGRLSPHDLERALTPRMSPGLRAAFNHAGRMDRWRAMLRAPKRNGLNTFISLGEDEYAHQLVLTFAEWEELANQTVRAGRQAVRKLRRIADMCERYTGRRIDVETLIESMTA